MIVIGTKPSFFSSFPCSHLPEADASLPRCLISHIDAAFGEKFLDITKAQRELIVQPDRTLNDIRRKPVAAIEDLVHYPACAKARAPASFLTRQTPPAQWRHRAAP